MTAVEVRVLDAGDVEVFRRIRLESLRAEPAAFGSRAVDWEALSDGEWRRRITENFVFVAFLNDSPVGVMGLIRQCGAKTAHRATIVMVYVRENLRGQGVSTRLLAALNDHARQSGIRQLELLVNVENSVALNFYRRNGFVEVGRIPGGYLMDGLEIDEIMMARRVEI